MVSNRINTRKFYSIYCVKFSFDLGRSDQVSEKKEYIERGALSKFVRDLRQRLPKDSKDFFTRDEMLLNFQQYVDAQPAADVEPVVRGEWVPNKRHDGCMACDQCGFGIETKTIVFMDCNRTDNEREFDICISDARLAHCPNCGARMERSGSGE